MIRTCGLVRLRLRMCFLIPLLLLLCPTSGEDVADSKYRLAQKLLAKFPKNSRMAIPSDNLTVTVNISIYTIFDLNAAEILEINGWATMTWLDPKLKWNTSEWPGIDHVYLDGESVWLPDIGIANSKQVESKDFSDTANKKVRVEVKPTGHLSYLNYFLSETPCPMDTRLFPFDYQKCTVMVSSYFSKMSDFRITASVKAPKQLKSQVGQWVLGYISTSNIFASPERVKNSDGYQLVGVNIYLSRKPLYHIILILIPYTLVALLGALLFVMKEPNDRFGMSLTIMMAMAVYIMIASQGAPKSMVSLSVMDFYLMTQMGLLTLLTVIIVLGPVCCNSTRKEIEEEEETIEETKLTSSSRNTRRRSQKRGWGRKCDCLWLVIYFMGSIANCIVSFIVVPMLIRYGG